MYSKKFTLLDIIESGYLDDILKPSIHTKSVYKKRKETDEETSSTVNMGSLNKQIANVVQASASRVATKARTSVYGGQVICRVKGDYELIYNTIVSDLESKASMLGTSLSHSDELETAIKESVTAKLSGREIPKMYLRLNSLEQIQGMTPRQKQRLLDDINENVYFNKDFVRTQASLGLRGKNNRAFFFTEKYSNHRKSYSTLLRMWERKVGANGK